MWGKDCQMPLTSTCDDVLMMFQVGQPKEVDDLVYGGKLKGGFFLEVSFPFSSAIAFRSV